MAISLPKVCPFLVTVDLKLKWPELPRGPNYPALPYIRWPHLDFAVCRVNTRVACPLPVRVNASLVPRPETARRKGPGFHCLRMR